MADNALVVVQKAWQNLLDLALWCDAAAFSTTIALCAPFAETHLSELAHHKAGGGQRKRSILDKSVCRYLHRLVVGTATSEYDPDLEISLLVNLCFVFTDQRSLIRDVRDICGRTDAIFLVFADAFEQHVLAVLGDPGVQRSWTKLKACVSFCHNNAAFATLILQRRSLSQALIAAHYTLPLMGNRSIWQLISLSLSTILFGPQSFQSTLSAFLEDLLNDHNDRLRTGQTRTALTTFIHEASVWPLLQRIRVTCNPDPALHSAISGCLASLSRGKESLVPSEHTHATSFGANTDNANGSQLTIKDSRQTKRVNLFDGDDFDARAVPDSQISYGSKSGNDDLSPGHGVLDKSKIYAALAMFEPDDDEMDDTYDVEDVGGFVEGATLAESLGDQDGSAEKDDHILYTVWKADPAVFEKSRRARDTDVRKGLRTTCNLTDEQIEGWASILVRNPQKMRRLESQCQDLGGRANSSGARDFIPPATRGSHPGSSIDQATSAIRNRPQDGEYSQQNQVNRRRKENAAKASRANHSRKSGRARKTRQAGPFV